MREFPIARGVLRQEFWISGDRVFPAVCSIHLDRIRNKRNQVIHSADPVTLAQVRSIWTDGGLFSVPYSEDPDVVKGLMLEVLKQVSTAPEMEKLLVRSLYRWGLNLLQSETAS